MIYPILFFVAALSLGIHAPIGDTFFTSSTQNTVEVRELTPQGFVTANKVFYSPEKRIRIKGDFSGVVFENDTFNTDMNAGVVKIFPKNTDAQDVGSIEQILRNEGVRPEDCVIEKNSDEWGTNLGAPVWFVFPKKEYIPTEDELFAYRKQSQPDLTKSQYVTLCDTTPECAWDTSALELAYNSKVCSSYVKREPKDMSYFQIGTKALVYVHTQTTGGGGTWIETVEVE